MEPQLPTPNMAPEHAPLEPKKPDQALRPSSSGVETKLSLPIEELRSGESHERKQSDVTSTTTSTSTLPVVIPSAAPVDDTTHALGQVAAITASNDDVIEKEWVNKSKKIVKDTKGDPYRKEYEISKLQADYMFKRYGKEVKVPDDV